MNITQGDFSDPRVIALLNEHLAGVTNVSPHDGVHALDLEGLRAPDVTFWTAELDDDILGCGALRELDPHHGEIKSMRTAARHLRKGVATIILHHIINEARARGYTRLSLETGTGEAFIPAHALYEKFGFIDCGSFGDYRANGFSRFMMMELTAASPRRLHRDRRNDGAVGRT